MSLDTTTIMATTSEDVDLVSEVEDVEKELKVMTGKDLDPIDINDVYDVVERLQGKFPTREQRVQETVKIMARKMNKIDANKKENGQIEDMDGQIEDQEELSEMNEAIPGDVYDNAEENYENAKDVNKQVLNSLIILYPDVDRMTLKRQVEFYGSNLKGLEAWMIANVETMQERKQFLAISSLLLNEQTKMKCPNPLNPYFKKPSDKVKSQCPDCEAWKIVNKGDTVTECEEVACGIKYCLLCNKKDHEPFECRKNDEIYRMRAAKDTNNIFKPLLELPTSQKDGVKRFVMFPKNDMDWTNPLDILYMAAEATFLRMVDRSPRIAGNITRKSILSIEYIENQSSTASFLAKQDNFLANGINSKERLCFHGTPIMNIDNILKENFNNDRIKRKAYGTGHYFSEFPDVSAGYGSGLLLCRILLGTSWTDSSPSEIQGKKFNSKLVRPDKDGKGWAIVVPDSEQILPAFVIKLREDASGPKVGSSPILSGHSHPIPMNSLPISMLSGHNLPTPIQSGHSNRQSPLNRNIFTSNWVKPPVKVARRSKSEKRPRRNSDPPPSEFDKHQRVEPPTPNPGFNNQAVALAKMRAKMKTDMMWGASSTSNPAPCGCCKGCKITWDCGTCKSCASNDLETSLKRNPNPKLLRCLNRICVGVKTKEETAQEVSSDAIPNVIVAGSSQINLHPVGPSHDDPHSSHDTPPNPPPPSNAPPPPNHETSQYKCKPCGYIAPTRYILRMHIDSFHGHGTKSQFKCGQCAYVAPNQPVLRSHYESNHAAAYSNSRSFHGCSRFNLIKRLKRERNILQVGGSAPDPSANGSVAASRLSTIDLATELKKRYAQRREYRGSAPDPLPMWPDPTDNCQVRSASGSAPSGGSALQAFPELILYSDSDEETPSTSKSSNVDRNESPAAASADKQPGNVSMDTDETLAPGPPPAASALQPGNGTMDKGEPPKINETGLLGHLVKAGTKIEYPVKDGASIGRSFQCDVVIPSTQGTQSVSRIQAIIYREGDSVFFETMSKTKGSMVNMVAVHWHCGRVKIQDGDQIELGEVKFIWKESPMKN